MIRLAWSLDAADAAEPAAIAERATEAKVGGVDLSATTADAALTTGQQLVTANVPVICLATTATLPAHLGSDSAWLDPARQWVMAAAQLGADTLRLQVTHDPSARNRPSPVRLADQLAALAELAGQQLVRIVLETRGEFAQPADLWRAMELGASKNVSACCCVELADPSQTVAEHSTKFGLMQPNTISILNLRIKYVHLRAALRGQGRAGITAVSESSDVDATGPSGSVDDGMATPHEERAALREGADPRATSTALRGSIDDRATTVLRHLRGIGYDGWIALQCDHESIVTLADAVGKIIAPPKAKPAPATATHKK